jgi:hypothetical protein
MPAQAEIINLNDATPAAPTGQQNVHWQKGATTGNDAATGYPIFPASANMPPMVGDAGAGGVGGAVPAPGAGDTAAGKFLRADGVWSAPPVTTVPTPVRETPAGTLDGSNRAFSLSFTPTPSATLSLALNGVLQDPGVDFAISSAAITYTTAPKASDWHLAWYTH